MLGWKREEVIEGWRKLRNDEFLGLYSSFTARMTTSGWMRRMGHVARMGENIYRVSQEECEILRESVPYVKLYRYNPKYLYPNLNGYGDNGQRKVWTSFISAYCTSTAV